MTLVIYIQYVLHVNMPGMVAVKRFLQEHMKQGDLRGE